MRNLQLAITDIKSEFVKKILSPGGLERIKLYLKWPKVKKKKKKILARVKEPLPLTTLDMRSLLCNVISLSGATYFSRPASSGSCLAVEPW